MKLKKFLKNFNEDEVIEVREGASPDSQLYEGPIYSIPKKLLKCKIDSENGVYIYSSSNFDTRLIVSIINKIYYVK